MSKNYTAQEMREQAEYEESVKRKKSKKFTSSRVRKAIQNAICDGTVAEILVQFAEDLEREEGLRKRYTAQDVRTAIQMSPCDDKTAKVLMRYEKYLERKNLRGKKYEYAEKYYEGDVCPVHKSEIADDWHLHRGSKVVRRSVGEWEEIS